MFAKANSRFSRIFGTVCGSTAFCGSVYIAYKYPSNNFVSSFASSLYCKSPLSFTAICSSKDTVDDYLDNLASKEIDDHFHLMDSISTVKSKISANKMLDVFRAMYLSGNIITIDFLQEMFYTVGIEDERIAHHLFELMDRNCDGVLQPSEIMTILTLFSVGSATQRFKFLFRCLDLDGGGTVDKAEFRATLTAILEAQYHMGGLNDPFDSEEIFSNVYPNEYHTVAKFKANKIVRDIFLVADTNRDGELSLKEFLHWCRTGNKAVRLLESALLSALNTVQ